MLCPLCPQTDDVPLTVETTADGATFGSCSRGHTMVMGE